MTKEQIEEASKKFAEENIWNPGISCESDIITLKESVIAAFKDGANWRINSVWHKPEEVPEAGKDCLVEYVDGDGCAHIRIDKRSEYEWIEACHYDRILRWAYIEDLIPTEDETA